MTYTARYRGGDGLYQHPVCGAYRAAGAGRVRTRIRRGRGNPGATRWQSFRKVVLPELSPALLAGVALSFTRSLGEFGAVIFIAGNIAWKTEVTSLMIFVRLQEFDYPAASAIASVILAASLLLLFSINTLQSRFGRRVVGH